MFSGCPIGKEALAGLPIFPSLGPRLGGVGLSGAIPFETARGIRPLAEAIQYRVFGHVLNAPRPGHFAIAQRLAEQVMLRDFLSTVSDPMDRWEWILQMPTRRRKALIRALRKWEERGCFAKNVDIIKPFVKSEHLPFFAQYADCYGPVGLKYVARLIQAPHDETHLVAGPWLKPLVGRLKQVWNHKHWLFYASVAPEKLDEWLQDHSEATSWFWADYSSFDATFSKDAWEMLESFYRTVFPHAPLEFWQVLEYWRAPHGKQKCRRTDIKLEYQAPEINCSGRDDTALANALMNGILLSLSFACALHKRELVQLTPQMVEEISEQVSIAVVGDDSLVACKFDVQPLAADVVRVLEQFGLQVREGTSHELVDVTFLGMFPLPAGGRWFWAPTLGRRLYKAFWQLDPTGNLPAWTLGVAKQLALYRHCPFVYDIAQQVIDLLPGGKVTAFQHDPNRIWHARSVSTALYDRETIRALCHRYRADGMSETQVLSDLQVIRTISRLPAVVRLSTLDICLRRDEM